MVSAFLSNRRCLIHKKLVDTTLLTIEGIMICKDVMSIQALTPVVETQWLNDYHEEVWQKVSPLLQDDKSALDWLKRDCHPFNRKNVCIFTTRRNLRVIFVRCLRVTDILTRGMCCGYPTCRNCLTRCLLVSGTTSVFIFWTSTDQLLSSAV